MFHNYFFIRKLSQELLSNLKGSELVECFSQNKDELILSFLKEEAAFYIQANFDARTNLLNFPENFSRARRNSVDLFTRHIRKEVEDLVQIPFDRSFYLLFKDGTKLLFKLHGRKSNILFWQSGKLNEIFRSGLKNDLSLEPDTLSKKINLENPDDKGIEQLKNIITSQYLPEIHHNKEEVIKVTKRLLEVDKYYLIKKTDREPMLSLIPTTGFTSVYGSVLEACRALYKTHTREYLFEVEKGAYEKRILKEIKKSKNYIVKNKKELEAISDKRSFEEIANIIMANLHQIDPKSEEVTLEDFYHSGNITIKIKRDVTPQKFAENLYRKSKNQKIQIAKLKENLAGKKTAIIHSEELLQKLNASNDFKSLRSLAKSQGLLKTEIGNNDPIAKPYIETSFDGFQIFIGKNAKSNDTLTLKHSHKDDIWLHARDVPGSHVIIKNSRKGPVPTNVIEHAAAIAAFYSKRKSESLCPVIYTPKKYVRKRKGALPGEVVVDREKVILIEPKSIGN